MINLLDPLFAAFARLTVARGILFPDLVERLKSHYIEAVKSSSDGKITDSRLSVLTGLQRRDISRLRKIDAPPRKPNHLANLVALWQTEVAYTGPKGPKVLPKNGAAPSFEALARLVRRDVHPRTMLDALVAAKTVEIGGDDRVILLQLSYQPLSGSEDQLTYLAQNLGDHLSAATDNVLGQSPAHFERAVHYSNLNAVQVAELKAEFGKGQMALLQSLNQRAAAMKKLPNGSAPHRFRAGGYFYQTAKDDT